MKRFVQFTKDLIRSQYASFLQKLSREKIPCAFFAPIIPHEHKLGIIENLQNQGIDLKYLILTEKIDAPTPPKKSRIHSVRSSWQIKNQVHIDVRF